MEDKRQPEDGALSFEERRREAEKRYYDTLAFELEHTKRRWENGSSLALFEALLCCGKLQAPMPEWCVEALEYGVSELWDLKSKSLDDVFGSPFRKGTRLEAHRREAELSPIVYWLCGILIKGGESIGPGLFERVSCILKETGLGYIEKTTVEKYYYARKKIVEIMQQSSHEDEAGRA